MIVKLRIDDRLLHGQVAYSWTRPRQTSFGRALSRCAARKV